MIQKRRLENSSAKILVIDDEPRIHRLLTHLLRSDFSVHTARSGEESLEKIDVISPDLILLDLSMPQMSGIEVLRKLAKAGKNIPVIILTGYGSIDSAVRAMKLGAIDYIEKPFDNQKLEQTLREIIERRKNFQAIPCRQNIVGESPQIQRVWQLVEKYGPTDLPILIQGETGTGKELFARAIHEISKRRQANFVPVDCSTIPETLFESEFFGYEKGAFTGAIGSKPGQLDWADKGTIFLDEVSNLPLFYQAKLLRVIQERQYVPLGARRSKTIDARFISSSNINIEEAIKRNAFRQDLYYRISGVLIELPPLRERVGDIELLTSYFLDKYARRYNLRFGPASEPEISSEVMELLLSYSWPGNVRELEQVMSAAVVSAGRIVLPEHLPPNFQREIVISKSGSELAKSSNREVKFELNFCCDVSQPLNLKKLVKNIEAETEKFLITEVKNRYSMNQAELAKFLGLDPKTLRAKVKGEKRCQITV